jgi:Pectate lyase superfamily protein
VSQTYINVKEPPYNATGDGVTDDYAAIIAALNDAAGRTVYFPAGTYLVGTRLFPSGTVVLLGEDRDTATIKASSTMAGNAVIVLPVNSSITNITLDADFASRPQPMPIISGIILTGSGVKINRCRIRNCSGAGVFGSGTSGARITDSEIDNTAEQNINVSKASRILVSNCRLRRCGMSNIQLTYCPNSQISRNIIGPSGPVGAGIYPQDCDNLIIEGNIITRCRGGIEVWTDVDRLLWTGGNQIINNLISRNYNGGLSTGSNGVSIAGNNIADNGHGGINRVTSTIEPGITVDPSFGGSGYQAGDILTLLDGTGRPAKVMVLLVFSGGSLHNGPGQGVALYPIDMGNYSRFPDNPVDVTGGHGTGAKVIYTNSRINAPGSGYAAGDVLRATNGTFTQAVRLEVTAVRDGAVIAYELHDGGGYSGELPASLNFANEFGTGTGFTPIPCWGKRYSSNFLWTFGLQTVGPVLACSIISNIITSTREGPAIMLYDQAAPFNGRMNYSAIVANVFRNNAYSIKGKTGGGPFDDAIPANNKIDLNIGYP